MTDGKYKLGSQFAHADKKAIPLVVVLGEDEIASGTARVKRLADGYEVTVDRAALPQAIRDLLA